jgi:hypothetical protein
MLGSDFGDSLLENSLDLIPKALGETIPDLAAWTDLFNEYRESDEYNWARATTLIERSRLLFTGRPSIAARPRSS